tara:strand:- start:1183 stop:1602 length:420 start_codon:yes stop_codon:yes gene_type:complete
MKRKREWEERELKRRTLPLTMWKKIMKEYLRAPTPLKKGDQLHLTCRGLCPDKPLRNRLKKCNWQTVCGHRICVSHTPSAPFLMYFQQIFDRGRYNEYVHFPTKLMGRIGRKLVWVEQICCSGKGMKVSKKEGKYCWRE